MGAHIHDDFDLALLCFNILFAHPVKDLRHLDDVGGQMPMTHSNIISCRVWWKWICYQTQLSYSTRVPTSSIRQDEVVTRVHKYAGSMTCTSGKPEYETRNENIDELGRVGMHAHTRTFPYDIVGKT